MRVLHRAESMQERIPYLANHSTKKICADNAISNFFDGTGIPHHNTGVVLFNKMMQEVTEAGPGYNPPGPGSLGGGILERQYEAGLSENQRLLGLEGVAKFGVALTTDGATIQKSPMTNCLAVGVMFASMMLLKVNPCSP